jgi:inosine-uridine nucleoside N-ribohydrolase
VNSTPRKVIIDTDPGVGIPGTDADDPIALLLALADPRLDVVGVTTVFGNCPPALAARGAVAVLRAAGRADIPVSVGSATPLSGSLPPVLQQAYAGARGRAGRIPLPDADGTVTGQSASDFIVDTIRANPGEITIVAIGPQTNLALALQKEPSIRDEINSIIFMGGGLGLEPTYGKGNITPDAECNVYFDPWAADMVLSSGIDLTMVGLDVTNPATGLILGEDTIRGLCPAASSAESMLAAVCWTYLQEPMFDHGPGCVLYDPLAVAVAADASIGTFEHLAVQVETRDGQSMGQTRADSGGDPNVHVMVHVDGNAVVNDIVSVILSLNSPKVRTPNE